MKTVFPEYYNDFKCIASDCTDTCCAGWEIVVDAESIEKYNSLGGRIGDKIRAKMTRDDDGDIIFINESGRCPFLTGANLCEIYTDAGRNYLCRTCDMFPRFSYDFGSVREKGLGLACPAAAELILGGEGKSAFVREVSDEPPTPNDIDARYYLDLLKIRKNAFDLLDDESLSIRDRLADLLNDYKTNGGKPGMENPFDLLDGLEILTDDWREIITGNKRLKKTDYAIEYKNIAGYYIYRYLLSSVFDGDHITKIKFCVFSCAVINRAADSLGVLRAAQLYSKEIEYSADNLNELFKRLKRINAENIISFL